MDEKGERGRGGVPVWRILESSRVSDYADNLECEWDIGVPIGYHIRVHFDRMDIAKSENCTADALIVRVSKFCQKRIFEII